jgi:hypothetical protein
MLNTINGFDLLLIITIVVMGFRIYNLNRECESYVRQILEVSWEMQSQYDKQNPPFGSLTYNSDYGYCDYCTEAKPVEIYPKCTCVPF